MKNTTAPAVTWLVSMLSRRTANAGRAPNFIPEDVNTEAGQGKIENSFNVKTKSSCPSCGTEGSQLMMSERYKGYALRDLPRSARSRLTLHEAEHQRPTQDCPPRFRRMLLLRPIRTRRWTDCVDCHMPFTMSCEKISRPSSVRTWPALTPSVVLTCSTWRPAPNR